MSAKVLTVVNQKGGVSKTTTAVTLGHGLALKGYRVCILDTDPQGQVATMLGVDHKDSLFEFLTPPRKELKDSVLPVRKNLWILRSNKKTERIMGSWNISYGGNPPPDILVSYLTELKKAVNYLIIDTGPTTGGLQDQAIFAADGIIIPTTPDYPAAEGVAQVWGTLQVHKQINHWPGKIIGILTTKYQEGSNESKTTWGDYCRKYGEFMLAKVHYTIMFQRAVAEGKTIWEMEGKEDTLTRAANEYACIVNRVVEVL